MYLDTGTLIAICIALESQLIVGALLFRSAYMWERHYREAIRMLKIERAARR